MKNTNYWGLTDSQKILLDSAEKAMENSYSPYSSFHVGAAILTQDGKIITGTNVENAAYGSTICAERGAIMKAIAEGQYRYDAMAIIAKGENFETKEPTGPCGSCRQMLKESRDVSDKNLEIIMSTTDKSKIVIATLDELLPFSFGPKDLGINVSKWQNK